MRVRDNVEQKGNSRFTQIKAFLSAKENVSHCHGLKHLVQPCELSSEESKHAPKEDEDAAEPRLHILKKKICHISNADGFLFHTPY